jgi:hypothetical protein
MAIVLTTVAVCHLVVRLRTDPILRRSSFRGLIESNSNSRQASEALESGLRGGETPPPKPAYGFTRRVRGEFIKETTFASR